MRSAEVVPFQAAPLPTISFLICRPLVVSMKSMCSKNDIRRDGNRVYTTAECKFGESAAKLSSVTTFTGETAYHTETKATYNPPMPNMPSGNSTMDGRWVSACPAGMQPGDIMLPDGRKFNSRTMAGGPTGTAPKK